MTLTNITDITDMAKRLNDDFIRAWGQKVNLPPAFFITDQGAVSAPVKVISELPRGFGVIFRDYDHPGRPELGELLSASCRKGGILFLVAGDADLAHRLKADGIHLPEVQMDQAVKIRTAHPHWMITLSCHDGDSVRRAENLPVDAALIAPVFATLSHPDTIDGNRATLGPSGVAGLVRQTALPLYGLGGIGPDNIDKLAGTGVAGIAAIRGFGGLTGFTP